MWFHIEFYIYPDVYIGGISIPIELDSLKSQVPGLPPKINPEFQMNYTPEN